MAEYTKVNIQKISQIEGPSTFAEEGYLEEGFLKMYVGPFVAHFRDL